MAIIAVHEIGNVVGWLDMALAMAEHATRSSREEATVDVGATIRDARMGVRHIADIVHALQGLGRHRETESELFDPVEALHVAIRFAEPRISARATLVEDINSTPMLRGRKHELTCVFLNLLHNALDALPEGTPETDTITVITKATGGEACFEVHDTGVGIPAEVAERVFDPYFSGSPDHAGLGIGLHVCRRIVREMGGQIGFESSPGVGTRFRVVLPGAASGPPTPAA
ncbi:MAG: HAMP domain-containing histidine kinase [Deltaproteobacteria bacterium]|nr:HAMP domain-containing histidine kinase [Deltaproteobacteria bacterium]